MFTSLISLPAPKGTAICAKAEYENTPSGTHYDRVYPVLLSKLEAEGKIDPLITEELVETTSGNAGLAFAMEAKRRGYRRRAVFVPESLPEIRKSLIRQYATLVETPADQYIAGSAEAMGEYLRAHNQKSPDRMRLVYSPNHSQEDISARAVAPIATEALAQFGMPFNATILAAGNGTTLKHTIPMLREHNPGLHAIAFETEKAPVASTLKYQNASLNAPKDLHSLYGTGVWGVNFPLLIDAIKKSVDEVQLIGDEWKTTQTELKSYGYDVGPTSASAYYLAVKYCQENPGAKVLIIFYDQGSGRY